MLLAALKTPGDDFEALKPYVTADQTTYFSAADVITTRAILTGTSMPPPKHDMSSRRIVLNDVPAKDLLRVVEHFASERHLKRGKPFPNMHILYSPGGMPDSERALLVSAPWTPGPNTLETLAKAASRNEKLKEVWVFDMRPLSVVDEMRVRVRNKGRIPYIDSIQR